MIDKPKIIIVGAGPMALDYAKVLKALNCEFITIGNSKNGAKNFEDKTGTKVILGGIENFLKKHSSTDFGAYKVIVAVNEHLLGKVTRLLIKNGFKSTSDMPNSLKLLSIHFCYKNHGAEVASKFRFF